MAEANYCPKCDKLVYCTFGQCMDCESRTVKLFVNTEKYGFIVLLLIGLGFAVFIAWDLLNITPGIFPNVIVGSVALSCALFGSVFYIIKKQQPVMDAALERGRKLYSENREDYDAGRLLVDTEMPPAQFPWAIRNIHRLRIALAVFAILVPIPMVLGLFVFRTGNGAITLFIPFLTTAFLVVAIFIHISYGPAKRHYELIKALNLKPDEVKKSFKSLTVKSNIYGDFELTYDSDYGYHLRMPLDSKVAKYIPIMDIWKRPNFISKLRNKSGGQAIRFQWMNSSRLEAIKSLKQIKVEDTFRNKMLFAALDDKTLYSETEDIVQVVRLLREAKSNLESEYADRVHK